MFFYNNTRLLRSAIPRTVDFNLRASVCKFYFKFKNVYLGFWDIATSILWWNSESYQAVRVVPKIQGWLNIDRRLSTFGAAFTLNWRRFQRVNLSCHSFKSTIKNAGGGNWMSYISKFVSYHFNGRVKYASRRSEIRSATCCDLSRTFPSSKRRRKRFKKQRGG